ncbi:MAG TPA: hypothetical protein VN414_13015, partial [Methanosarcina sp.]|nr:hypothetical protein [Methanosarcina sp.]
EKCQKSVNTRDKFELYGENRSIKPIYTLQNVCFYQIRVRIYKNFGTLPQKKICKITQTEPKNY